jgi:MazG family protein
MTRPFAPVVAPPLAEQTGASFVRLVELMQRLLAPDGCPWDREQTFSTLRRYVLEEACEVVDAIDGGDRKELCSELGDLLLQVVFQAEIARLEGAFGPDDVVAAICDKLVRRHPHVFADASVEGASDVLRNWERIKAAERASAPDKKDRGVLGGVAHALPALTRAQRVGEKVSRVGFDWPDARGSREKVNEEIRELDQAIASGDQGPDRGRARRRALRPRQPLSPRRGRRRGRPPPHHRQVHAPLRSRRIPREGRARRLAHLHRRRQAHPRRARRLLGRGQAGPRPCATSPQTPACAPWCSPARAARSARARI